MAQDRKDNTGALFKARTKLTDRHPDMSGSATIAGVEYWVSGWKKVGGENPYISLSFTKKEARKEEKPKPRTDTVEREGGDDLPF